MIYNIICKNKNKQKKVASGATRRDQTWASLIREQGHRHWDGLDLVLGPGLEGTRGNRSGVN